MAEVKITALPAYSDPVSTDVLPIVDVTADLTKKVSITDLLKNAATGSETAPAFAFDADPDTGMYRRLADELAFSTGGTGRLFIDSSGNIGVGTASPQAPLSFGATAGTAGTANKIRIYDSAPNIYGFGVSANQFDYISDGSHVFYTSNGGGSPAEKARIDSSGRLLVGTTTAGISGADNLTLGDGTTATGLSVRSGTSSTGNIFFSDGTSGNEQYRGYVQYNHTDDALILGTTASDRLRIDSSGNVGIGTSSPGGNLTVTDASTYTLDFKANGSDGALITTLGGSASFALGTDNTERMRIDSSGNVGIGESSPSAAVHVKADLGDSLRLDRNNTGAVGNQIAFRHSNAGTLTETASINCVSTANADSGTLRFYTKASGGSNTERMRILSGGGLTFNGDTAQANALDDYEEGTWTPTSQTAGYTLSSGFGRYTKIGRVVVLQCVVQYSAVSSTNNATAAIGGLPFTAANFQHVPGIGRESSNNGDLFSCQVSNNATTMGINAMDGVSHNDNDPFATNENYVFQVTYTV